MYDLHGKSGLSSETPEFPKRFREEPDDYDLDKQNHSLYWIAVAVLALAIAGLCWYGYPTLKQLPATLAKFPALQNSLETMNARLSGVEGALKTWGAERQQLRDEVAQVEDRVSSRLSGVHKQMQAMGEKIYQRVHGEVAAQKVATDTELARLRIAHETDQANVEKLQTELATLREESARQSDELRNVRSEMDRSGSSRDQQLASLHEQVGRASQDLEGLHNKLAVKRVDFEVSRNRSQQLTDEVSLGITGTDISHRRVTGWMWVASDRRTIWLRGHGAQEPVIFYGAHDGKRRELVITNVAKDSVTGYLLLAENSNSAPATKGD